MADAPNAWERPQCIDKMAEMIVGQDFTIARLYHLNTAGIEYVLGNAGEYTSAPITLSPNDMFIAFIKAWEQIGRNIDASNKAPLPPLVQVIVRSDFGRTPALNVSGQTIMYLDNGERLKVRPAPAAPRDQEGDWLLVPWTRYHGDYRLYVKESDVIYLPENKE